MVFPVSWPVYCARTLKYDNSGLQGYRLRLPYLGKTYILWSPLNGAKAGLEKSGRGLILTISTEYELTRAPKGPCTSKKLIAPLYMLLLGTHIKFTGLWILFIT